MPYEPFDPDREQPEDQQSGRYVGLVLAVLVVSFLLLLYILGIL